MTIIGWALVALAVVMPLVTYYIAKRLVDSQEAYENDHRGA